VIPATPRLGAAVELLERSLGYTRLALAEVSTDVLGRPTPCAGWSLDDLLSHMDDALDAFTEAASGIIDVRSRQRGSDGVGVLQDKACALLGAWSGATETVPGRVVVGGAGLAGPVVVATAALEIAVHGWDVSQATGTCARIPDDLARRLLVVAREVVDADDRDLRFAQPLPVPLEATPGVRLLAFLGRAPSNPPGAIRHKPGTRPDLAS
jgi:uncharacterized protein (TIGR03086 family)